MSSEAVATNKTGIVQAALEGGVLVQLLLQWKNNNYYIF
jgi:hypothetical protein